MCGILGSLKTFDRDDIKKNNLKLSKILNSMIHRGPDYQKIENYKISASEGLSEKYLSFGFARLSIIDLSENGNQPMHSADGRYKIIFNGEIYNYLELRNELKIKGYIFKTKSDTEVLLNAWIEWDFKCLKKIIGMFAFAIFDNKKKKLTLIRDAFGIKPLFFCVNGTSLSFCSELSPILKIENCKFKLNLQNIYDYLVYSRYDHNHFTFVENICHLLPGHYIAFDLENINLAKQRAWWEPDTKEKKISYLKATKKLKSLFLESINLHLRSDVNIGVMLSGGIDSSSIVSAIKFLNPKEPVTTFSYISSTQNISEEKYIDYINKNFKTTSYKIKGEKFHINTTDFDNLISKQGEPFGGPSICASYILYKMIKKIGVKVIVEGQGADEILAGYNGFPGQRLLSLIECKSFKLAHEFSKNYAKYHCVNYFFAWKSLFVLLLSKKIWNFFYKTLFLFNFKKSFFNDKSKIINYNYFKKRFIKLENPNYSLNKKYKCNRVKEALISSLKSHNLPALLRHSDRNSMAFSIENRVPFLTLPIVNFLLSLPEDYLISKDGVTKRIFKDAMKGIVPDLILDRKDKIGFAIPIKDFMIKNKKNLKNILKHCNNKIFNKDELLKKIDKLDDQDNFFYNDLFRYINYIKWYDNIFKQYKIN